MQQHRRQYIADTPFSDALVARFAEEHPQIPARQHAEVFDGLRQWFEICRRAKHEFVSMPSLAVDGAWHEFILFTRDYERFCRRALGRYLHHTPNAAVPPGQAESTIGAGFFRAWEFACLAEGMQPGTAERLPLIFAIDERVGLADGFHYDLVAIRNEWVARRGRRWWPGGATGTAVPAGSPSGCAGGAGCGAGHSTGCGGGGGGGCGGGGCGGG